MPTRERLYRTEAVVLRRQELGEADRLLVLYSPERGKLRAIAKGVRRARSRKAGHLELFHRAQLMLARGRELDVITQAEVLDPHPGLQSDLDRLGHAAYIAELVDGFGLPEENRPLYRLLVEGLELLDAGGDPAMVLRAFELHLLDRLGYRPQVFACVACGAEIRPVAQFFSWREGGVLCPACGPGRPAARPLALGALKVMRHIQRSSLAAGAALRPGPPTRRELEGLLQEVLTDLLERRLHAPEFIQHVRRLATAEPA